MPRSSPPLRLITAFAFAFLVTVARPASAAPAPLHAPSLADPAALSLADAALAKLTLEEKVSLLAGAGTLHVAGIPRVGIPGLRLIDGTHNIRPELRPDSFNHADDKDDHSTSLPAFSALATTWDTDLALRYGEVIGREARDRDVDIVLGPAVNLARTPLCGRNWEYPGEDPVLAARIAVAYIRGLQSQDVAACIKHFIGNEQELNRFGMDARMEERTLRELYAVPFEAAVREAGVLTVMNSYNRFRGEFASHNDALNNSLLKAEWGFPGLVMSDWGGTRDTVEAALGGLDLEMNAGNAIRYFRQPLLDAVRDGKVPPALIDDKARRILYVLARLGKLDARVRAPGARNTPGHQAFAREVAERAIVLLKNTPVASSKSEIPNLNSQITAPLLPLSPARIGRLLVIGQNANTRHCYTGYSGEGNPPYEITPLDGLRRLLGDTVKIEHIPGPFTETFSSLHENVIETIDATNLTQGVAVKGWTAAYHADDTFAAAPLATGFQRRLSLDWRNQAPAPGLPPAYAARLTTEFTAPESGAYLLQLAHDGRARLRLDGKLVLEAWTPGPRRDTRTAPLTLEKGRRHTLVLDYAPAAKQGECILTWRPPSAVPLDPAALAARAAAADTVLFFTGNRHGHGRALECENGDRPDLSLPEGDDEAIAAVLAAQPRTIVLNHSGAPVAMPWADRAPALVQYGFIGMEAGNALARVLFGRVNPSGKLTQSFPRALADSPAHALDDYRASHADYREGLLIGQRWHDAKNIPALFPFGHGLSYTTFAYSDLAARATGPAAYELTLTVKNTGPVTGDEIVQLYVEPKQSRLPRPIRELKTFARVRDLAPGESRRVTLTLGPRDFSYYDPATSSWVIDPGTYVLHAAASARDPRATVAVVLR